MLNNVVRTIKEKKREWRSSSDGLLSVFLSLLFLKFLQYI